MRLASGVCVFWLAVCIGRSRTLTTGNRIVRFNITMALLLVGSMIPVLLGD